MSDKERDDKLEQIAHNLFGIEAGEYHLQPDMVEVATCMVDLKTALQLAYKFGQDSKPVLDEAWNTQDDKLLPEDAAISAAFPTRSGRHDLYGEAMRLVGAKYSKGALVALVNWLLHRAEKK